MVKKLLFILLLFVCLKAEAEPLTYVLFEPLHDRISTSTVTVNDSWSTAPTVAMRGRKEIIILNTSSSDNGYVSGQSPNTVWFTLYPRQWIRIKAGSDLHVFVTANTAVTFDIMEIR